MLTLFKVRMAPTAAKRLEEVFASGFIAQGDVVDQFESLLKDELGLDREPILVNSCTSALDLSYELIGIGPGDEVITTPQTCFATNTHLVHRGAKIIWADIDPLTGLIDPDDVARKVTTNTKAIVVVDWAGKICDFDALKVHNIPVVEDAAHVWVGSTGETHGTRGDYVCYSLQAIKFLTAGDGGIMIVPEDVEHRARNLRWFGLDRTTGQSFRASQDIPEAGYKYNMNNINAAIGIENMRYAAASVRTHRKNAKILSDALADVDWLSYPEYDPENAYWLFSIVLDPAVNREDFIEHLGVLGIASNPVHYRNDGLSAMPDPETPLPGVDLFGAQQTNIPVGWWLERKDLDNVVFAIKSYRP